MATSYIKKFRLMIMGTPSFVSNVEPLVAFLDKTKQGHSVLTYFGEHAPNAATFSENQIAVAIKEQDRVPVQEPIKTSTFGSWKESGPAFAGGTLQPIIRFPDFKTGRNILLSMSGKPMTITDDGSLVGHVDFPNGTPMDAVLFHEFCHAYLIAIGLGAPLSSAEAPDDLTHKEYITGGGPPGNISENVEEQIVCGLLAGRGLALCENAYRVERKLPPRVSYSVPSVNIKEDTVLSEKIKAVELGPAWTSFANTLYRQCGKAGPISYVLAQNGFQKLATAMSGKPEAAVYGHGIDPQTLFDSMTRGSPGFHQ